MEGFLEQDEQFQKDKRCILPWIHQYGDINGEYGLCCFSIFSGGKNTFGKNESPISAFNSQYIKQTRLDMLAGKIVKACDVCYDWEKQGIQSHRERMNQRFYDYRKLYETTLPDGSLKSPPIYLDFRFGNLCNFSCRMCGSYASSSWAKEEKYYGRLSLESPNHYDHWTNNIDFWKDIESIKKYIKVLYFAGGEPFVQEGHYKLLKLLIKSDLAKNIELDYNTNLSYSDSFKGDDIEKLWKHFGKVDLWPSIEGFNEKAEYGRKGLNFDLFKENSLRFSEYIDTFSLVSSIYSISSNIDLIKWIKSIDKTFNITNLTNPSYQSTTVLPKELKKYIIAKYKKELSTIKNINTYEINSVLDSLRHMNSFDDNYLAPKFKERNVQSDLFRNESFESVFPELAEWYRNI